MQTIRETINEIVKNYELPPTGEDVVDQVVRALEMRDSEIANFLRNAARDAGLDTSYVNRLFREAGLGNPQPEPVAPVFDARGAISQQLDEMMSQIAAMRRALDEEL